KSKHCQNCKFVIRLHPIFIIMPAIDLATAYFVEGNIIKSPDHISNINNNDHRERNYLNDNGTPRAKSSLPQIRQPRLLSTQDEDDRRGKSATLNRNKVVSPFSVVPGENIPSVLRADNRKPTSSQHGQRKPQTAPSAKPILPKYDRIIASSNLNQIAEDDSISILKPEHKAIKTPFKDFESLENEATEILTIAKEKIKKSFFSVRKLFKTSNPFGHGNVNKQVFHRILSILANRPISMEVFNRIIAIMSLQSRNFVSFDDYHAFFRRSEFSSEEFGIFSSGKDKKIYTAARAHLYLKRFLKQRIDLNGDDLELFTNQFNHRIYKVQLKYFLDRQTVIYMEPKEFDKLWLRYDTNNTGAVRQDKFLAVFGIRLKEINTTRRHDTLNPRKNIQYREIGGKEDNSKSKIRPTVTYNNIQISGNGIDTPRSTTTSWCKTDRGNKNKNHSEQSTEEKATEKISQQLPQQSSQDHGQNVDQFIARLEVILKSNLPLLLKTMRGLDKTNCKQLNQSQFRQAINEAVGFRLSDQQIAVILKYCYPNQSGKIQYEEFIRRLQDSQGSDSGLFNGQDRTTEEIHYKLTKLISNRYQEIENAFYYLDQWNTKRLTQSMLQQLLQKFEMILNDSEIRQLWSTILTNSDRTVDFYHFIRHFGFCPKNAAFANAKRNPPRRGDFDMVFSSKKLHTDSGILIDKLKTTINQCWKDLEQRFKNMDHSQTGTISCLQFKQMIHSLCPELNADEIDEISQKFLIKLNRSTEERISYLRFLKPFTQSRHVHQFSHEMRWILSHQDAHYPTELPIRDFEEICQYIRTKTNGDYKPLYRTFIKQDQFHKKKLKSSEVQSILNKANLDIDRYDMKQIALELNKNPVEDIPYYHLLSRIYPKLAPLI
ncbi:EF-hand calcium-binding domain-containing protein 6, partial [Trichoplax sp. H2]